jgi:hypothetical protein
LFVNVTLDKSEVERVAEVSMQSIELIRDNLMSTRFNAICDHAMIAPGCDGRTGIIGGEEAGARAGPPEDSGGPPGYQRLVEALGTASDPEHDEYRAWVGEAYDPERIDL